MPKYVIVKISFIYGNNLPPFTLTNQQRVTMYAQFQEQSNVIINQLVKRIMKSGKVSRQEYSLLTSSLLVNAYINAELRTEIDCIFNFTQTGRLQLIDR